MIKAQTPDDRDAFFEQYSEEQVRHAFDMVADEHGNLPEELAEYQQAYDDMTVDPQAMSRYREVLQFRDNLFRATPRIFVTRLLLAANLLVFLAMALSGVSISAPTGEQLIDWGANAAWLTLDGQSWRLFTCMFLHIGVIHLGFNMYLLWQAGNLLERLTGNVGFFILYIGSGLIASLASLYWTDTVLSAGASGAVFGICGGLLAFIWRSPDCDMEIFGPLLSGITKLILLNLALGIGVNLLSRGLKIDMAAHIGGLLSGGLFGCMMARPINTSTMQDLHKKNALVFGTAFGLIMAALTWAPAPPADPSEITREALQLEVEVLALAKQQEELEMAIRRQRSHFSQEQRTAPFSLPHDDLRDRAMTAALSGFLKTLEADVLPKWDNYYQRATDLRPGWPKTLPSQALDDMIKFIEERRSGAKHLIKELTTPTQADSDATACPEQRTDQASYI